MLNSNFLAARVLIASKQHVDEAFARLEQTLQPVEKTLLPYGALADFSRRATHPISGRPRYWSNYRPAMSRIR